MDVRARRCATWRASGDRSRTRRRCTSARSPPRAARASQAPELARTWIALGDARAHAGEPDAAQEAFRRARRLSAGDAIREADTLRRETELADRFGDTARAVRAGLRGLRRLDGVEGAAAGGCRARLLAALATARLRQGRCDDAIRLCAQAIVEGEAAGDDEPVAHACFVLDWALHDAGRAEEAVQSDARARDLRRRSATSTARPRS